MLDDYEAIGDPHDTQPPTKQNARRQAEAAGIRASVKRMHFHEVTVGASAGAFTSHTHEDDELGHAHEGRQAFPRRADGGYWEEKCPSLGTATPKPVAANLARAVRPSPRLPLQARDLCLEVVAQRHRPPRPIVRDALACTVERRLVTEPPHHVDQELSIIEVRSHEIDGSLQIGEREHIDSHRFRLGNPRENACVDPRSDRRLRYAEKRGGLGHLGAWRSLGEVTSDLVEPAPLRATCPKRA